MMYGFCYEHGRDQNLEFKEHDDVIYLADLVEEKKLHVAKECMVVVTSNNSAEDHTQVVLTWPTCSKSEIDVQRDFIKNFSQSFNEENGAPLLCWATDGDNIRRQIFDSLMTHELKQESKIYPVISSLKLIDTLVGANEETVDFDARHLAKRTRNTVISPQFLVGGSVLTRKDVTAILSLAKTSKHSVEQLVNPADKQNVSLATDLITFSTAVKSPELASAGFRVASIVQILKLLGLIMEGILALYCYVTSTIEEQLIYVSTAAHALLVLKRVFGTVLPNQLYDDLISTFENVFFCAAKYQVYHPLLPLLIVLLGTDVVERLFGNMHLKYGHNGFDSLELLYCTRAMREMLRIMSSHPTWTKDGGKVMDRLSLDYSKPINWQLDKLKLEDVNIKTCWDKGRLQIETYIQESKCEKLLAVDFFNLVADKITLLKPNGRKIGVTELSQDWSSGEMIIVDDDDNNNAQNNNNDAIDNNDNVASGTDGGGGGEEDDGNTFIDVLEETGEDGRKNDLQVCVNGMWFHKSTILKQTFLGCRVSKDRLRRVQGLSKHVTEKEKSLNLDDVLLQGDVVLFLQKDIPKLGSVTKIQKAGKKVKMLPGPDVQTENVFLVVKELELMDMGATLEWSRNPSAKVEMRIAGKLCHTLQPEVVLREDCAVYVFEKSLLFDLGISLKPSSEPSNSNQGASNSSQLKKCFLCVSNVALEGMKVHAGKHILNGNAEGHSLCGYCGRASCQNKLCAPTKKGGEYYYNKVESNCPYYIQHTRRVKKASKKYPCTNYLNKCILCKADVWSYTKNHCEDMHPDADAPMIDPEEVKLMTSKK